MIRDGAEGAVFWFPEGATAELAESEVAEGVETSFTEEATIEFAATGIAFLPDMPCSTSLEAPSLDPSCDEVTEHVEL